MKVKLIRTTDEGPIHAINFKYKNPTTKEIERFRRRFALERKEAEELGNALQVAARKGRLDEVVAALADDRPAEVSEDTGGMPFSMFTKKWFKRRWTSYRPRSREAVEVELRLHYRPFFVGELGDPLMSTITTDTVEDFKTHMEEKSNPHRASGAYAPKTVVNLLITLRGMFTKAILWGYAMTNPTLGVEYPEYELAPEDFENFLFEHEIQDYLDAVRERYPQWYVHLATLVATGMRTGEAWSLRTRDILWRTREILVRRVETQGQAHSPKGGRSRKIPVGDWLLALLEDEIARHPDTSLVFPNTKGMQLHNKTLELPHHWARTHIGIERRVTLHGLRHTVGTLLAVRGKTEEQIRRFLGHADTRMVQRYMHLRPEHDRAAAKVVSEALGFGRPGKVGANGELVVGP